ncbi:unnamed protein product [Prunus armeniaca]
MEFCKKEIHELLQKKIIRKSKSPWSCPAFYVQKNAELERGVPRLVINYKPLNSVLEWIRYPIPNKRDLINRLEKAVVYSKFDMKSGFWQIQIDESDRYKTAFVTPFGHYEWNNGLVVSAKKIKLFQTNIRFLGFNICQSQISPIDRSNPPPWSTIHTEVVKQIKAHVKTLQCLGIPSVDSFKIVETDASDIGYGGILKQRACPNSPEQIVRFHSGCTMAPKKDKQKESANQPKPSQSLRILPPSMSSTVGQIRPSYQSTLISSYDPFSVDPSVGPSVAFKKTSPYMPKSNSHLFVIEPVYDIHSNPVDIAKHYFPPGFHYMPPSPYKSLKYYRDILLETQYKVPWILKWSYKVTKDTRVFARQFSVKWWDKFEVDRIAKYVYNDLPHDPIPHPASPTGSTLSSLSVEGKSKSELQEIARQLIIQASQMDDDEDNDSPSSSS